jgi:hypothetical protein
MSTLVFVRVQRRSPPNPGGPRGRAATPDAWTVRSPNLLTVIRGSDNFIVLGTPLYKFYSNLPR